MVKERITDVKILPSAQTKKEQTRPDGVGQQNQKKEKDAGAPM